MKDKDWKQVIGGKPGLIMIGVIIILMVLVALDEILDLPYLLLKAPLTPRNWAEIAIEIVALLVIGLTATVLIRQAESKRKKAKEALLKSENRLKTLFECAPDAYFLHDMEGRFVDGNKAAEELVGYNREELIGKSFLKLKLLLAEQISRVTESLSQRMPGQPSESGELTLIRKDGNRVPVEISSIPMKIQGKCLVLGIARNITDRKKAEEALRESEERYKVLLEGAAEGILVADVETKKFKYANPAMCRMLGYTVEELKRMGVVDIHPQEALEYVISEFEAQARGEKALAPNIPCLRKDGTTVYADINTVKILVDGRECNEGFFRDVTERKKLHEQLIHSEKLAAVGTLAYGIAHEFNNILAGILANAELGLISSDSKQIKECFGIIAGNCNRASSITHHLLGFVREKEGKTELIDITQPLQDIVQIAGRELEKVNIKVVEEFRPIPKMFCDPGQFSGVFLNMITNARDAMTPKGGTLTIKVDSQEDNIRIIFKDTGSGIPEEIKGRIFDPFVTTKGALGRSEIPGTGLGLFLTYGIIESYQGKIEVESKVGKGSQFTILIPISRNLPRRTVLETVIQSPTEIQEKLNILLVDDEKPICTTLKRFLESKGHKVTTFVKAEEGLGHFRKEKFDVVLSDITMPDMDGIELIKKIRKKDKKTKIIVMTGHIQREKEKEAKEAGADEVLIKPFKNKILYRTISRVISG